MVPLLGIELRAFSLQERRSTTELERPDDPTENRTQFSGVRNLCNNRVYYGTKKVASPCFGFYPGASWFLENLGARRWS